MDIHKKQTHDFEAPLSTDAQEMFAKEYVRLDIEDMVANKRARRIQAYREAYSETDGVPDHVINTRAVALLRKSSVSNRIKHLYEEEGSSVESEFTWTKTKSEGILVDIAYSMEEKTADRLKAISELNKMRGIEKPELLEEESKGDSVDAFFDKFKGMVLDNG